MITSVHRAGKLPDGGQMRAYAKGTVRSRKKRGRQTGFVDLTDTGKMFRSLDFKTGGLKAHYFSQTWKEQNSKLSRHIWGR